MGKPIETGLFLASLGQFSEGMNSDVPPVALPSTQLSYAENCTVRGNFVTQRSAWLDSTMSFASAQVQDGFEDGKFQGSCFYQSDSGEGSLIASVSGRLFKVTPQTTSATVTEISIPNDTNPDSQPQSWLWQSENFVVVNDGQSLPIFFDGNASRRSNGPSVVLGTIATSFTAPAVGEVVTVTLTGDFLGEVGDIVYVGGARYEVVPGASAEYEVTLTNYSDTAATQPIGTKLYSHSNRLGACRGLTNYGPLDGNEMIHPYGEDVNVPLFAPLTIQPGYYNTSTPSRYVGPACIQIASTYQQICGLLSFTVEPTTPYARINIQRREGANTIKVDELLLLQGTNISTVAAELKAEFTVPAIGQSATAKVLQPYTGEDGAYVWIGNKQYGIEAEDYGPIGTGLNLRNIDDNPGTVHTGDILSAAELSAGKMGAYGLGRNWVSMIDGQSYLGSDIVGGSSGTAAFSFRDSVIKVNENNYLAGGGVFRVPSAGQQINAMRFPATLDSSLGQGPLQVLTQDTTFSCNAPVQRLEWQDMVNPIQTQSLVGGGALSHYSCVAVNGDLWFRADDGIRSLKLARQDFQVSYANTPQSVEMNRVLLADDRNLLQFSSAVVFDNRLLMTASPAQSQGGVYHSKLIALNLDPNSSMRIKQPPVYDGAWKDRNVLQLVVGTFQNIKRCFAFTYDSETSKIGLSEIQLTPLPGESDGLKDNGSESIEWMFESPAIFYQEDTRRRELLRLCDGEMFVKDLAGTVRFDVYYRPDYSTVWTPWHSWEVTDSPNFQPRMGLGTPTAVDSGDNTGRPSCVGYHFQVKVIVTGSCVIMGMNFFATTQPGTSIAPPVANDPPLTPKVA